MQLPKIFLGTALGLMFVVTTSFAADVAKIGVIDLQKTLETSDAGKDAQAEINKEGNKMKEDLKKREGEIEELKNRLDREALVMSSEMREEKERDYRIKVGDFKNLQKKYLTEIKEVEKKLSDRIQAEVSEVANELGKNEGYLMIIEKTVVLYYPTAIDVTDKVIQLYNSKYSKNKPKQK